MALKKLEGYKIVKIKVPTIAKFGGKTIEPNLPNEFYKNEYVQNMSMEYDNKINVKASKFAIVRMLVRDTDNSKVKDIIQTKGIEWIVKVEDAFVQEII